MFLCMVFLPKKSYYSHMHSKVRIFFLTNWRTASTAVKECSIRWETTKNMKSLNTSEQLPPNFFKIHP